MAPGENTCLAGMELGAQSQNPRKGGIEGECKQGHSETTTPWAETKIYWGFKLLGCLLGTGQQQSGYRFIGLSVLRGQVWGSKNSLGVK